MRVPVRLTLTLLASLVVACGDDDQPSPRDETMVPGQPAAEEADTGPAAPDTASPPAMAEDTVDEAPPTEPEAPGPTGLPEGPLYTVQLGAFVEAENASAYAQRLEGAGFPVWTETARVQGRSFQRIRVGVTMGMTEARELESLVEERLGRDVWIAPVTSRDRLRPDALEATRRLLEGGA